MGKVVSFNSSSSNEDSWASYQLKYRKVDDGLCEGTWPTPTPNTGKEHVERSGAYKGCSALGSMNRVTPLCFLILGKRIDLKA